ncbi:MAG: hypothetical protein JWM56_1062 [Candidatus Peribacteria bacterium]|nr:hypothetical protein [Candidatus Peribacteria bacterium]
MVEKNTYFLWITRGNFQRVWITSYPHTLWITVDMWRSAGLAEVMHRSLEKWG